MKRKGIDMLHVTQLIIIKLNFMATRKPVPKYGQKAAKIQRPGLTEDEIEELR